MRTLLFVPALAVIQCFAMSAQAGIILDFNEVPSGTLLIFSPFSSQGFDLISSSGGFVFNSPDTGNGSLQTVGNNPFYAGANGLAAFSPSTIVLLPTSGDPFSLLSIDLARIFAFDPAPTVTFTGILAAGGTVTQTFSVTNPAGTPMAFETFQFTGFTGLSAVTWDQPAPDDGLHQFGNIQVATSSAVPEPSSLVLLTLGIVVIGARSFRRTMRAEGSRKLSC